MKLSLGLNLVCVGVLLWPPRVTEPKVMPALPAEPELVVAASGPPVAPPARPFHWSQVESTNYIVYIANLRAVGCPEETIRDIISADLLAAIRNAPALDASGGTQSMEIARVRADYLATRLLHPSSPPLQQVEVRQPEDADTALRPDGAAESSQPAGWLENRRQRRLEAMERLWLPDSIRARYGVEALLDWQQQAVLNGISFAEFLDRNQISVPPLGLQSE